MFLDNKTYDVLKWVVLIFLPALAVFVKSLGDLYMWQEVDLMVMTINAFTAFMGTLLQISSENYHNQNQPPRLAVTK